MTETITSTSGNVAFTNRTSPCDGWVNIWVTTTGSSSNKFRIRCSIKNDDLNRDMFVLENRTTVFPSVIFPIKRGQTVGGFLNTETITGLVFTVNELFIPYKLG